MSATLIGVPREIKDHEYRVGVTPAGVDTLHAAGHRILVQTNAGARVGFGDDQYSAVGARPAANLDHTQIEVVRKAAIEQQLLFAVVRRASRLEKSRKPSFTGFLILYT